MNRLRVLGAAAAGFVAGAVVLAGLASSPAPAVVTIRTAATTPAPAADDAPPVTSTTAPYVPVSAPPTTATTIPPAWPAEIPTTIIPPLVVERPARPGHYACTGDDNATADCAVDGSGDVTPNTGDDPSALLSATDPAYSARLDVERCGATPWLCENTSVTP